ncbi:hypothetical protein M407DRAFT_240443 [Tulasnella calospora MUT 4182]|uniref:Uncharacterized protein n=1 Tax=Tulasnella calospora MUT 4182 TaxID=1051891 RepID=A0A0C3QYY0_9AGAM|nr:hypothetical protein M407DRAFT_240443 [Tulasnella calospora MUT 4182]
MDMDEEQLWAIGLGILGIVIVGTVIGNILTSLLTWLVLGFAGFLWRAITWFIFKIFSFAWAHRNTIFIVAVGYFLLARYLARR